MVSHKAMRVAVISQDLDNPALCDLSASAAAYHPLQFGLQGIETSDLAIDFAQMGLRDLVGLSA